MEENNNSTLNQAGKKEVNVPPQVPIPPSEKSKDGKRFKIFISILVVLGLIFIILSFVVAPILLKEIDPVSRLNEAHIKACSNECSGSKDSECVNKCLQSKGSSTRITQAKITPSSTPMANPKSVLTLTPTPTIVKKITSVPKPSLIPNVSNISLTIEVGIFNPDGNLLPPSDYHTITIENTSTGKSQVETKQNQVLTYYNLDPGAYRITTSHVGGKLAASYYCYNCHATKRGTMEGYSDNSPTVNVNIEKDKPVTIWFVYHNE